MNWFKENPFLSGLLAVTLLATATLGFFLFQSWSSYGEVAEACTVAIEKLHKLQNKVPYPSDANLKAEKAGLDDYREKLRALRVKLSKMELPVDEKVTPQLFQDNLRAAVNGIKEKAAANNVRLPEKFYLGFERYQSEPPSSQAAPQLNREMRVLESFVTRLVEYKIQSLNELKRSPLPQEEAAAAGQKNRTNAPVLFRYPFAISFAAEQSKIRLAFNALLGAEQFVIVRSLSMTNTATKGPSRKTDEPSARSSAGVPDPAAGSPAAKESIKVLFGRELIKADLYLEILDFVEPPAPTK